MPRRILPLALLTTAGLALVSGCGQVKEDAKAPGQENRITSVAPQYREGAKLFVERCSGCHNFGIVGAEGGSLNPKSTEPSDGPDFNVRKETVGNVIFAIHNGGMSGQIMPPNLAVGDDAKAIAEFLAYYAGYGGAHDRTPDGNSRRYKGK